MLVTLARGSLVVTRGEDLELHLSFILGRGITSVAGSRDWIFVLGSPDGDIFGGCLSELGVRAGLDGDSLRTLRFDTRVPLWRTIDVGSSHLAGLFIFIRFSLLSAMSR